MQNKNNKNLLNPATAVSSYLDTLLQPETDEPDEVVEILAQEPQPPTVLYMPVIEQDLAALEKLARDKIRQPEVSLQVKVEPPGPGETLQVARRAAEQEASPQPQRAERPAPEAADVRTRYDFPMQCLMFNVAGIDFSLPLIEMGSVLACSHNLTRLPGSPPWFLGLLQHRDRNIRVVDSARLLRLERSDPDETGRHILVFGESEWAMTCDQLGQVVRLQEEDIQWKAPSKKSLSLGTIRSSLALLLDPAKLLAYLDQVKLPRNQADTGK
jgi:purine-binding chemotaxis protein CheW